MHDAYCFGYAIAMNSQVVKEQFSEIQNLRSMGESWKSIASSLFGMDSDKAGNILGIYFRREVKRRSDPDLLTASDWVKAHRKEITKMLRAGESWIQIGHTLGSPIPLATSKGLKLVAGEYYRTSSGSPKKVKEPTQPQAKATPLLPAPALGVSAGQSVVTPVRAATEPKVAVASVQAPNPAPNSVPSDFDREVESIKANLEENLAQARQAGLNISAEEYVATLDMFQENIRNLNMPRLAPGERMSPERYADFLEFAGRTVDLSYKSPEYDPEMSIAEFTKQMRSFEGELGRLCERLEKSEVPEAEIEQVVEQRTQMFERLYEMKAIRDYMSKHQNALFTEISVMATVGVADGVIRVCEASEPGAMELRGIDRPAGEYPNPVYVIEQFTEEEAKRVKEAHDLDLLERGMGVKRRLYEALCVRGLAKHELNPHKDKYPHLEVHVTGRDFPSPWLLPYVISPSALKKLISAVSLPLLEAEVKRTLAIIEPPPLPNPLSKAKRLEEMLKREKEREQQDHAKAMEAEFRRQMREESEAKDQEQAAKLQAELDAIKQAKMEASEAKGDTQK